MDDERYWPEIQIRATTAHTPGISNTWQTVARTKHIHTAVRLRDAYMTKNKGMQVRVVIDGQEMRLGSNEL